MFNGYAYSVKKDEYNHKPIKPLLFDCMTNFKTVKNKWNVGQLSL